MLKGKLLSTALILTTGLTLAGSVLAGHHEGEGDKECKCKKFEKIDANSDGNLSKQELIDYKTKKYSEKFDNMDENKDGVVSKDEYKNAKKKGHKDGKMCDKHEKNGDKNQEEKSKD